MNQVGVVALPGANPSGMVAAFGRLGFRSRVVRNPAEAEKCERLVVPGVGSFGPAAEFLAKSGFYGLLQQRFQADKPILGVCLGFHLLCRGSEEAPQARGLGIIEADVKKLDASLGRRIPHMGWSKVRVPAGAEIEGLAEGGLFYFAHSFEVVFPVPLDVSCTTTYGGKDLVAAFRQGSVVGVQFHPEKSNESGLRLLKSFAS